MGNLFGQLPQPPPPPRPPRVSYQVMLPTSGRSAWEQLYCGDISTWDSAAARYGMDKFVLCMQHARYGMDKFAYRCDSHSCDREAVCLNYMRASLETDQHTITIHRYKAPSVQVPVNTSTELQALLSAGLQLSAVVAAERGGLALLEVRRSLHNTTHVAFPLVVMGPGTHTGDDSREESGNPSHELCSGRREHGESRRESGESWREHGEGWREEFENPQHERCSSRREHGESRRERKKPTGASMNPHQQPGDRHTENSEGLSGGGGQGEGGGCMGEGEGGRCVGVLHAPHRDMTPVNCQLSPDLSHTSVLFYCQPSDSEGFCYMLHCYCNPTPHPPTPAPLAYTHTPAHTDATAEHPERATPHLVHTVMLSHTAQPYFAYDPRYAASRIAVANYECPRQQQNAAVTHELVLLSVGEEEGDGVGEGGQRCVGEGEESGGVGMVKRGNLSLPSLFGNSRLNLLYTKDGELIILQKLKDDRFGVTSFCDFYIFTSQSLRLIKYIALRLPGLFHICRVSYQPVFSRCGSFMRVLDHGAWDDGGRGGRRKGRHVQALPLPPKLKDYLRFRPLYY
ncbi:hypothetical protein ACOMHN_007581 [Nucella lapillus]